MTICSAKGRISVQPGQAAAPDLVLTGPPDVAVGLLARRIDPAEARGRGLAITDDLRLLRRLRPSLKGDLRTPSGRALR
jgi:hypothetical protein